MRGQALAAAVAYVVRLLWAHARLASSLVVFRYLLAGVATPLIVWTMAGLIDALAQAPADPWSGVTPWLTGLFSVLLIRGIHGAVGTYINAHLHEHLNTGLRRQVLEQAIALPLAMFEQPEYYQHLETSSRALNGSINAVLRRAMGLVAAVISTIGLLVLYVQAHWALGLLLATTTFVPTPLIARIVSQVGQVYSRNSPLRRELGYWGGLLAGRDAAPELRLFGLGRPLLARWDGVFGRYIREMTAARIRMAWQVLIIDASQELILLLVILALILLALPGTITIGTLAALLYGLKGFRDVESDLYYDTGYLVEQWRYIASLREFLALAPESGIHRRQTGATLPRPLRDGVQFHHVSFTYPGAARPALADISLTLRPHERVALVGENGAGKTTLVRLLLGLYTPQDGRITVDGIDLRDLDPAQWRREATAIFQDFMRYPSTVGENIAYADVSLLEHGVPLTAPVPARIGAAAARSGAANFIQSLPRGYATPLGKEFEGGTELSLGQWQRLALARAYLRDAQIIVLDEPTAALDPRAEVAVYRQFRAAAGERCAVFISHRLGSARLADRIIVLRAGRIVEKGTHAALLQYDGEFARMYRLQASWYRDSATDGASE
ncbi:MAG: hypothetical protein CL878_15665 [Dehalococcoidia bacterium]|nr:hypothetical protein [Dehalococcoidia bacterium]